jgi:hypothetical protein
MRFGPEMRRCLAAVLLLSVCACEDLLLGSGDPIPIDDPVPDPDPQPDEEPEVPAGKGAVRFVIVPAANMESAPIAPTGMRVTVEDIHAGGATRIHQAERTATGWTLHLDALAVGPYSARVSAPGPQGYILYESLDVPFLIESGQTKEVELPLKPRLTQGLTWTCASPSAARRFHVAALLPSGQVLLAGGTTLVNDQPVPTTATELHDPATERCRSGPPLISPRAHATATVLPSGQVLVVGGDPGRGFLDTAELYTPDTHTWTPAGTLASARAHHTATLLPSGKVLVVGGMRAGTNESLATAELYDPTTNSWSAAGTLASPRAHHTATLLPSGQVLVVGGTAAEPLGPLSSAELFAPDSGSWKTTSSMRVARSGHTATLLLTGQVLIIGGAEVAASYEASSAELYAPEAGTWSEGAKVHPELRQHTATLMSTGRVLVAGGTPVKPSSSQHREVTLRRADGAHEWTGSTRVWRSGHTATLMPGDRVLLAGSAADPVHELFIP